MPGILMMMMMAMMMMMMMAMMMRFQQCRSVVLDKCNVRMMMVMMNGRAILPFFPLQFNFIFYILYLIPKHVYW